MAIQRPSDPVGRSDWATESVPFHQSSTPTVGSSSTALGDASIVLSMENQLVSLYAERSQLQQALGVSDADEVIAMVEELRANGPSAADGPSLEELQAKIAELDRWSTELTSKSNELTRREAELALKADELASGPDQSVLSAQSVELAERAADLATKDAELARRAHELADRDAELAGRIRAVTEHEAASRARAEELTAAEAVFAAREAQVERAQHGIEQAQLQLQADREAFEADKTAAAIIPLGGDDKHRPVIRRIIEEGPLFDKVRSLEEHLYSVYETIDRLTGLVEDR